MRGGEGVLEGGGSISQIAFRGRPACGLCSGASHVAGSWITPRATGRIPSPPAPPVVSLSQCRELTTPHSRGAQLRPPGYAAQGNEWVDGVGPSTGGTEVAWLCCLQTAWGTSIGNPTGPCEQSAWVHGVICCPCQAAALPVCPRVLQSSPGHSRVAMAWCWRGCATVHTHQCLGFAWDRETGGVLGVCWGEAGCGGWIWQHPGCRQVLGTRPRASGSARATLGFHPASASQHHASCVSDSLF